MASTELTTQLEQLLEPVAEEHGYELVAVEQAGGRHTPIIRVLLDRAGGIDLEAVCEANAWVGAALDAADPVSGTYTLEVSSPGVDRPLRKRSDYERFAGETVTVKARQTGQKRSTWTGALVGLEGDDVVIDVDGEQVRVPFDTVMKARLKGVVSFKERGDA
jgi:ribosome maturation factor RimP